MFKKIKDFFDSGPEESKRVKYVTSSPEFWCFDSLRWYEVTNTKSSLIIHPQKKFFWGQTIVLFGIPLCLLIIGFFVPIVKNNLPLGAHFGMIGILVGIVLMIYLSFEYEAKKLDWLKVDLKNKIIELPRINKIIDYSDLNIEFHFVYSHYNRSGNTSTRREVVLVTETNDKIEAYLAIGGSIDLNVKSALSSKFKTENYKVENEGVGHKSYF